MRKCLSTCFILLNIGLRAQNIPLDTWRTHFSYAQVKSLVATSDKIWAVAEFGIFGYDKEDFSSEIISKAEGLSGTQISAVHADENRLFLGYESGAMDIIENGKISSILDLRDSDLLGSKRVNDISSNDDFVFFGTDFGIIVVSLTTFQIVDNFKTIGREASEEPVYEIELTGDRLVAITGGGVQSGLLANNLLDFTQWVFYEELDDDLVVALTSLNNSIFAILNNNTVIRLTESWEEHGNSTIPLTRLKTNGNQLLAQGPEQILDVSNSDFVEVAELEEEWNTTDFLFSNGYWFADQRLGLINQNGQSIVPNGPAENSLIGIDFVNNQLFGFYNKSEITDSLRANLGIEILSASGWTNITISDFGSINDVSVFKGYTYLSSLTDGLYNLDLESNVSDDNDVFQPGDDEMVSILDLESNANLWALINNPLSPLIWFDGSNWGSISVPDTTLDPFLIAVSAAETVWMNTSGNDGLYAYSVNSEQFSQVDQLDGLPSNRINSMAINLDDELWVATQAGIANYPDASFPDRSLEAIVPVFDGQLLFSDVDVNTAMIDGGNRLWVSTGLGLWAFDETGSDLIHQFNETNSPLPSNNIMDLAYDPGSGEVFILTDRGLVSYRSASSAFRSVQNEVEIFPNPVRPAYSGLVGIAKLVNGAEVSITDINGKLIRRLTTNGGTASWDLLDYANNRVQTGVYLVLSSSPDGNETVVGKIAVVN